MSASQPFDKNFIKDIAELLSSCNLTEIELEHGSSKLRVVREMKQTVYAPVAMQHAPSPYVPPTQSNHNISAPSVSVPAETAGEKVKSPMVGTIYTSPEPDSPPFIKIGDKVNKGDTLLIVEAMKVMNNIPAPKTGVIADILVKDKDAVEYDQPLVIIT